MLILISLQSQGQFYDIQVNSRDLNATGAQQNPLNLGNWGNPTSVPSYRFYTTDQGSTPLEINSTRYSGGLLFTREGSTGRKNLISISGWDGVGASMAMYDQSNQVKLLLNSDGTSYFNGGNVGIGTTNTGQYKLAVEGKIAAREIKVTLSSFADYVFNRNYPLRSLSELEKYINQYKHLPNIPSEGEVKNKGGIELGEMNVKLLEKIEELTLYVIELNKKIEKLEKEKRAVQKK